ncbi:MAG: hypothetical protein ACRCW9_06525 [Cetobacterium sp.]
MNEHYSFSIGDKIFYLDKSDEYSKYLISKINKFTSLNNKSISHKGVTLIKSNSKIIFKKTKDNPTKEQLKEGKLILHKFIELHNWSQIPINTIEIFCELYDLEFEVISSFEENKIKFSKVKVDGTIINYHLKWSEYRLRKNSFESFKVSKNNKISMDSIYNLNKEISNKKILTNKDLSVLKIEEISQYWQTKDENHYELRSYYHDKIEKFNEKIPNNFKLDSVFKEGIIENTNKKITRRTLSISNLEKEIFLSTIELSKSAKEIGFEIYYLNDPEVLKLFDKNQQIDEKREQLKKLKELNENEINYLRSLQNDKV